MSKDLFSKQSDAYARYRPDYPSELLEYILRFVPGRHNAWDCATGNGQAASLIASHFELVEATDSSEKQLSNAILHPRIHYSIAAAEKTLFKDHHFDLVTVAQAYHWFDFIAFSNEVKRVLKPDGIVAVWGYSLVSSTDTNLNSAIEFFYKQTVGPYWDAERQYIDEHYRTVVFPYDELPGAAFFIEKLWNKDDLCGYINTWSSVQHFIAARGFNPVDGLKTDLQKAWPAEEILSFRFPLFLRLGKINK